MWFHRSASVALMKRRKGPVLRMVLVAFVAALWCIAGGSWMLATWREIDAQAGNVAVEVYLHLDASDSVTKNFRQSMQQIPHVASARIVTGEDAWQTFSREIGVEDELRQVVDLPSIVKLRLLPDGVRVSSLALLSSAIERQYPDIVREVVWPRDYVSMLDSRRSDVTILGISAALLSIVMFSIALIYAFRAEIHRAGGDLAIGAMLGAGLQSIAAPHFIVGLVSGFFGLTAATIVGIVVVMNAVQRLPWLRFVGLTDVLIISATLIVPGIIISWGQSITAARNAEVRGR